MNQKNQRINQSDGVALGIVLSVQTGKIILVKNVLHKDPKWRIPGGTIKTENNETPMNAFVREVGEETGVQLEQNSVLFLIKVLSRNKNPHYYHVFGGFVNDFSDLNIGPTKEEDSDAVLIAQEFTIEEATPKIMLHPHFVMLREGLKKIHSL
ncbi:MAG: NUDIX hydrolase [Minisyncoccia bacterium]